MVLAHNQVDGVHAINAWKGNVLRPLRRPCYFNRGTVLVIGAMTIGAHSDHVLGPQNIEAMRVAFHQACEALQLSETTDAITEIVASKIFELARAGEIDPERLCNQVLYQLREQPTAPRPASTRAIPSP